MEATGTVSTYQVNKLEAILHYWRGSQDYARQWELKGLRADDSISIQLAWVEDRQILQGKVDRYTFYHVVIPMCPLFQMWFH